MQQRTLIVRLPAIGLATLGFVFAACGGERYEGRSPETPTQARTAPAAPRMQPASRTMSDADRSRAEALEPAAAQPSTTPPTARFEMDLDSDCPMKLEGVKVTALPKEDGMALAFETRSGSLDELRRRVRFLAAEYEGRSDILLGIAGLADNDDLGRPRLRVDIEHIASGVKILFAGERQSDIDAMRIELRQQTDSMNQLGSCNFLREDLGPAAEQGD